MLVLYQKVMDFLLQTVRPLFSGFQIQLCEKFVQPFSCRNRFTHGLVSRLEYILLFMFSACVPEFTFNCTQIHRQHRWYHIGCHHPSYPGPFFEGYFLPCAITESKSDSVCPLFECFIAFNGFNTFNGFSRGKVSVTTLSLFVNTGILADPIILWTRIRGNVTFLVNLT